MKIDTQGNLRQFNFFGDNMKYAIDFLKGELICKKTELKNAGFNTGRGKIIRCQIEDLERAISMLED